MLIINQGTHSAAADLQEFVDSTQSKRGENLGQSQQMLIAARALLTQEALRLKGLTGAKTERVQQLENRIAQQLQVIRVLGVEKEIAAIRTPLIDDSDTVIQGRLTNLWHDAVAGVQLQLVDAKFVPLKEVAAAQTDAGGYYAFVITSDVVTRLLTLGDVSIALLEQGKPVPLRDAKPFSLSPGTRTTLETYLTSDDIQRLSNGKMPLNLALVAAQLVKLNHAPS